LLAIVAPPPEAVILGQEEEDVVEIQGGSGVESGPASPYLFFGMKDSTSWK
jgi:hypothetical protein